MKPCTRFDYNSFKGNEGNLMQHWVLCELLNSVSNHFTDLTYVDAHSMAPLARQRTSSNSKFDTVFEQLPGQKSSYEQAWQELSPEPGTYPNSANFVKQLWPIPRDCSMLLCEIDDETVSLLRSWAAQLKDLDIEIADGDWRNRFQKGLPKPKGLMFISFDPYMFNRHLHKIHTGNMCQTDLDLLIKATCSCPEILVQLSTYSTNDGNPQGKVIKVIRSKLTANGFDEVAVIKPNKMMMSLIYQRGLTFIDELTSLCLRFKKWFDFVVLNTNLQRY